MAEGEIEEGWKVSTECSEPDKDWVERRKQEQVTFPDETGV